MKITLKQLRSLVRDGVTVHCIENTYRSELNGQERKIVKAQKNGFFWRAVNDHNDDGRRSWTELPKAADIVDAGERYTNGEPSATRVTYTFTMGPYCNKPGVHRLTLEFEEALCHEERQPHDAEVAGGDTASPEGTARGSLRRARSHGRRRRIRRGHANDRRRG